MKEEDKILKEQREVKISDLRASFAEEGEVWLTNDWYEPKDPQGRTTREILERKMREAHSDSVLRFDYEHIVAFLPIVMDGRIAAKDIWGHPDGEAVSVYAKPRKPSPSPTIPMQ